MRKRYRYLSHFSLTTVFQVPSYCLFCITYSLLIISDFSNYQLCEIDLNELLPPDALLPFMDEITKRAKQRKQLAKKVVVFILIFFP